MTDADCVLIALRVKATPERAFDVFTRDIGRWWQPDPLFRITPRGDGTLIFADGRLVCRSADGETFDIGSVTAWERGSRLAFDWRQATFPQGMKTRVEVTFEPVDDETRVTLRHFGWTALPREQAARHGFPDAVTQHRVADWWRHSLAAMSTQL